MQDTILLIYVASPHCYPLLVVQDTILLIYVASPHCYPLLVVQDTILLIYVASPHCYPLLVYIVQDTILLIYVASPHCYPLLVVQDTILDKAQHPLGFTTRYRSSVVTEILSVIKWKGGGASRPIKLRTKIHGPTGGQISRARDLHGYV